MLCQKVINIAKTMYGAHHPTDSRVRKVKAHVQQLRIRLRTTHAKRNFYRGHLG